MKPMTDSPKNTPSPTRRTVLTGMLGASTVVALAPAHWSKPVLNRMITPAHGQAVSIAAGRYSFTAIIYDIGGCAITANFSINWPGGVGPHVVNVEVDQNSLSEVGSCTAGDVADAIDLAEGVNPTVRIVTDIGADIPLGPSTPALPSGLFFVIDNV